MGWECGGLSRENPEKGRYLSSHLITGNRRRNTKERKAQ
jgi:hypothetical protein